MKRVRKDEPLDFFGHFVSLRAQSCELSRETRQYDAGSLCAQNDDGLLG